MSREIPLEEVEVLNDGITSEEVELTDDYIAGNGTCGIGC